MAAGCAIYIYIIAAIQSNNSSLFIVIIIQYSIRA